MTKQPHNLKKGDTKHFANLLELQEFCETYKHDADEFKVTYENGILIEKL